MRYRLQVHGENPMAILAGGFQADAQDRMIDRLTILRNESKTLVFKGGAYSSVEGGFYFTLN